MPGPRRRAPLAADRRAAAIQRWRIVLMSVPRISFLVVAIVIAHASTASAQSIRMGTFRGYLTGHLGTAVGGEVSDAQLMPGVSVAVHEQDGWGAELDFRSEEHTSELQSQSNLVCRLLLEKKKTKN